MIKIRFATFSDFKSISDLANEIWPLVYSSIISEAQISLMLNQLYTIESIAQQVADGHLFFILEHNELAKGFASISNVNNDTFKLQKLYLHPNLHGHGTGKMMIVAVENYCRSRKANKLILNVNRNNKAHSFYLKMGFEVVETVDIPYHQFVLNDFIMSKSLLKN